MSLAPGTRLSADEVFALICVDGMEEVYQGAPGVLDFDPRVRDVMEALFWIFFQTAAQESPHAGRNVWPAVRRSSHTGTSFTGAGELRPRVMTADGQTNHCRRGFRTAHCLRVRQSIHRARLVA
jgi:uncharacterized protein with von Willebrand factor type A (vWA) domain